MSQKKHIQIEPSILAGDFGRLAEEAKRIEESGADGIHIDIMDGHFVPNLALSPKAVGAINKATDLFLDVHIMVYNPFEYIERLVEMGADQITFHFEATEDVEDTINFIRRCGIKAGLAFNPETSEAFMPKYLDKCDLILLMTVNPGFGGQPFLPEVLDKVKFLRTTADTYHVKKGGVVADPENPKDPRHKLPLFDIQVDGGITEKTGPLALEAGANVLVAGTYLFSGDMKSKIRGLRG